MDDLDDSRGKALAGDNPWRIKPTVGPSGISNSPATGRTFTKLELVWIMAGIVFFAATCAYIGAFYFDSKGATQALETTAKATVIKGMRDPASVQFSDISVGQKCVTGKLNAKNAFGGYVGYRDFYYDDDRGVGQVEPEQSLAITGNDKMREVIEQSDFRSALADCQMKELNLTK